MFKDGTKKERNVLSALTRSFGGTLFVSAVLRLINDILLYLTPQVTLFASTLIKFICGTLFVSAILRLGFK